MTTVVMGNCGVGFAPVRRGGESFLIELMEGVEDIPGTALHEGIDWQWESFPEYLDAVDRMPRVMDVAAQVPHAALRAYVLGERAHEDATADEILLMAKYTEEALAAGAAGFTTSRTLLHSSKHGLVPGTSAPPDELLAIGDAIARAGHGVFQLVSDTAGMEPERTWMVDIARRTGATVTYALAQTPFAPNASASSPSIRRKRTSTGWTTCATGAFHGKSGGAIACRSGIAAPRRFTRDRAFRRAPVGGRIRTRSTHGSPPRPTA